MYKFYYVNNNPTCNPGFHHEVHTKEHANDLGIYNKTLVGYYDNEIEAVNNAKKYTLMPMVALYVVLKLTKDDFK